MVSGRPYAMRYRSVVVYIFGSLCSSCCSFLWHIRGESLICRRSIARILYLINLYYRMFYRTLFSTMYSLIVPCVLSTHQCTFLPKKIRSVSILCWSWGVANLSHSLSNISIHCCALFSLRSNLSRLNSSTNSIHSVFLFPPASALISPGFRSSSFHPVLLLKWKEDYKPPPGIVLRIWHCHVRQNIPLRFLSLKLSICSWFEVLFFTMFLMFTHAVMSYTFLCAVDVWRSAGI